MAKKQSNFKPVNTSNIDTDVFIKGMTKDSHKSFVGKESWTHCRNCINNSAKGDAGTVGNEPATLLCIDTGYTIIGAIYLYGDKWILYSTDDTNSEIGLFDDSECKYDPLINDTCLGFNKFNLITGAAKENYDCTWQVYWDDGLNPSRTINLGNKDEILENNYIPYIQEQVSGIDINGDPCIEFQNVEPLQLDCDLIRLAPLMKTPCVKLSKADSPGQLLNGSYQAYIAYLVNEQQIGNYIGVSNVQPLYDSGGTACSLDIEISNLDTNFSDYKLVILINNQQQPQAIQVGIYSTHQTRINIDYISENKATAAQVPVEELPLQNPAYERSDKMVPVNDYLLRIGPTTNFDFNYQPLANKITAKWVSTEYPAEYYVNGGNKPTFMRDEQYAFFIRFIYHTGEKSYSYHIPGRAYLEENPVFGNEKDIENLDGNNVLNSDETEPWQVSNTAFVDDFDGVTTTDDGGVVLSRGQMGYWESSEFYPAEDPHGRWQELCGQPIRHHKFPDEQTDETVNRSSADNQFIRILGVEFDNIAWPVDNEGNIITNIVGYEILVGSREGNKSILSKGIVRNMKQYPLPEQGVPANLGVLSFVTGGSGGADNPVSTTSVGVMPNYPYNDLRSDTFLTTQAPDGGNSNNPPMPVGIGHCGLTSYNALGCNNFYTFHSPETSFQRPFLNPSELKSYGINTGLSQGYFRPSEGHPKNVLIRDFVAILAAFVGIGFAISKQRGKRKTSVNANVTQGVALDAFQLGLQAPMLPFSPLGIETQFTASPIVPGPLGLGAGLGEVAYMQSTASLIDGISTLSSPVTIAGSQKVEFEGTDVKSLPNIIGIVSGLFTTMHYAAVGGQEVVDLVYNIAGEHQYAYKYNSYGLYATRIERHSGEVFRQNITKSRYVGNTFQDFGQEDINTNIRINNLYRPATVVVQTNGTADGPFNALPMPVGLDQSRNTMGDLGIHAFPSSQIRAPIAAHYVALKFAMDNQYGQLDGIKQVPIPCNQRFIRKGTDDFEVRPPDLTPYISNDLDNLIPGETFKTDVLFGGDVYVNRYSEKVIMPFFWEFLNGQPDNFGFDYRNYQNVPYPRYYMDTNKYDMHNLFSPIINFDFDWSVGNAIPSAMRNMDKEGDTNSLANNGVLTTNLANTITQFGGNEDGTIAQGSSLFVLRRAYMYTHNSGINDFFVESELNVAHRAQGEGRKEKYYDWSRFTDLNGLFHSDIIEDGNFYKYDYSLSKSNLVSQLISYSLIQGRDYDPNVADTCYDHYTKRVLYSLQAFKEAKQDFWRVYLPNNYKDFKNAPTTIKPISKSGAMILFPHLAPLLFEGVDTLTTDLDTKLSIGDGGLFSQPMKQITTADLPHEYGSCENSRSVINTPAGVYFISQAQGKIFNVAGQGLNNIADAGMKQWFNTYLPSRLIAAYPEIEGSKFADNPVIGIGCQAVYDPNYDIVYFSKKDYEPCNQDECLEFDPEVGFIINETECYGTPQVITCEEGFTLTTDENGDPICEQELNVDPTTGTNLETTTTSGPILGIRNPLFQPIGDSSGWGQIGEPWHMCFTNDSWAQSVSAECPVCKTIVNEEGVAVEYIYNEVTGLCCPGELVTERVYNELTDQWEDVTTVVFEDEGDCVDPTWEPCAGTGFTISGLGNLDNMFPAGQYGYEGYQDMPTASMISSRKGANLYTETYWEEGISQTLAYPMEAGTTYRFSFWAMRLAGSGWQASLPPSEYNPSTHVLPMSFLIYGTNHNCNDTIFPCNYDDTGALGNLLIGGCTTANVYGDPLWNLTNNPYMVGDTPLDNNFIMSDLWPLTIPQYGNVDADNGWNSTLEGSTFSQPLEDICTFCQLDSDFATYVEDNLLIGGGAIGTGPYGNIGVAQDQGTNPGYTFPDGYVYNLGFYWNETNETQESLDAINMNYSTATQWVYGESSEDTAFGTYGVTPVGYGGSDQFSLEPGPWPGDALPQPSAGLYNPDSSTSTNISPYNNMPLGNAFHPSFEGELLWDSWVYSEGGYDYFEGYKDIHGVPFGDLPKNFAYGQQYGAQDNANVFYNIGAYSRSCNVYSYKYTGEPCTYGEDFGDEVTGPCLPMTSGSFYQLSEYGNGSAPIQHDGSAGNVRWNKYVVEFTPTQNWNNIIIKSQARPDKLSDIEKNYANINTLRRGVGINGIPWSPSLSYFFNEDEEELYFGSPENFLGYSCAHPGPFDPAVGVEAKTHSALLATENYMRKYDGSFDLSGYAYISFIQQEEPVVENVEVPFCFCQDGYDMVLASDLTTPANPDGSDCIINGGPGVQCIATIYDEPTYEDVITEVPLEEGENFKDVSWTASYDPKIKGWISFHDWHPELTISSLNHFMTTKSGLSGDLYCPPNYEINPTTGLCEPINPECPEGSVLVPSYIGPTGETLPDNCCSINYGEVRYNPANTAIEYDMQDGIVNMFDKVDNTKLYTHNAHNTISLHVNDEVLENIKKFKPSRFKLNVPFLNDETLVLTLQHSSIRKKDFVFKSRTRKGYEDKKVFPKVRTYNIKGDNVSGTINIVGNTIKAMLVKDNRIYEMHKSDSNTHVLYSIEDAIVKTNFICKTEEVAEEFNLLPTGRSKQMPRSSSPTCITIAWDVDYFTYSTTFNGSTQQVLDWLSILTASMNEVYVNGLDTQIILGDVVISEEEDVYTDLADEQGENLSSTLMLNLLSSTWQNTAELDVIERTTAHLVTSLIVNEGRASTVGLCNRRFSYAVQGIGTNSTNIQGQQEGEISEGYVNSQISWILKMTTHELGHNIRSPHTHAPVWQADSQYNFLGGSIDTCDSYYSQYNPDAYGASGGDANTLEWNTSEEYGTVMSYCHLYNEEVTIIQGQVNYGGINTFDFHPIVKSQLLIPNLTQNLDNSILPMDVTFEDAVTISSDFIPTPCLSCPDIVEDDVYGCTDPEALNYNPNATIDDGSCRYPIIYGCTDPEATNYNPDAEVDDGTCVYPSREGCTDPNALNYNPDAVIDDGSCIYPPDPIIDCTDPAALNYNPEATEPCVELQGGDMMVVNACCRYAPVAGNCNCDDGFIMIQADTFQWNTNFDINTVGGYATFTPADEEYCLESGGNVECIQVNCTPLNTDSIEPSAESGSLWKHNVRCDLFNNYYDTQYPWEIELVESIGQTVNTIRSVEYQLESYLHQPKLDENGCVLNYGCDDRWHDLSYNFDEAIIYNTEQVSGLLTLTEQTADVNDIVSYPIIGTADINILYSKVEQKYRFDQFWDITNDRSVPEPIFITQLNGYVRDLNEAYMNYNKPQLERKKFRHYVNNLILRKKVEYQSLPINEVDVALTGPAIPHTRKMLLKLVNTKINLSVR